MNAKKPPGPHSQEVLRQKLKQTVKNQDLTEFRRLVTELTSDSAMSVLDCAAALVFLQNSKQHNHNKQHVDIQRAKSLLNSKMVRYRLEVGDRDLVKKEDLKRILVEEAGVDQQCIGDIDIRNAYTIISLPKGMPTDIYQILREVQINQQALKIKRLGGNKRKFSGNNKTDKNHRDRRADYHSTNKKKNSVGKQNSGP